MPRIPQSVTYGVFYLYASADDARAGRNPGGTGFVVRYTGLDQRERGQLYAVTNWHVACQGFSVIRLNTVDGDTDILDLNPDEWFFLPGKYDVAVTPITIDDKVHVSSAISTGKFAVERDNEIPHGDISIGDDVFMVGLFIDQDGGAVNAPSARFGNISMLPTAKARIRQPTDYRGVHYLIDMHSRSGFSGSPVYVYRTFGSDLTQPQGHSFAVEMNVRTAQDRRGHLHAMGRLRGYNMFKLLGILWGQFPEKWELKERARIEQGRRKLLVADGRYVEGWSGMSLVIPAWHIHEVLEMPELQKHRNRAANSQPADQRLKPVPMSAEHDDQANPQGRPSTSASHLNKLR